ncbi:MAG: hypothetical protein JXA11_12790 [Phycisphaerae bacterium]|nr:hypothetical protein [Phycisphaerae bacterium]
MDSIRAGEYQNGELAVSLNGDWLAGVGDAQTRPRRVNCTRVQVPAFVRAVKTPQGVRAESYHGRGRGSDISDPAVWYRKEVELPESWKQAGRVVLRVGAAADKAVAYVNGKKVGEHVGGFDPFEFDVTAALRFGSPNRVEVYCTDDTRPLRDLRNGNKGRLGLWQDVEIVALPGTAIRDVFVSTDPKHPALRVETELLTQKPFDGSMQFIVEKDGKQIAERTFPIPSLKAKEVKKIQTVVPAKMKRWSPEHPELYVLKARLLDKDGRVVHERTLRTGFRRFEIRGRHFYLNGVKTCLREGNTGTPLNPWGNPFLTKKDIREFLEERKSYGVNCIRIHQQPGVPAVMDVADEVGMLMIEEFSHLDELIPPKGDTRIRDGFVDQMAGVIRRDRNHPSVVLWGIANEGWYQSDRIEKWKGQCYLYYLAEAKKADSTRIAFIPGGSKGWAVSMEDNFACASMGGHNPIVDPHYPAPSRALTVLQNVEGVVKQYDRPLSSGELIYFTYPKDLSMGDRILGEPFVDDRQAALTAGWYQTQVTDAWRAQGIARYGLISGVTLYGGTREVGRKVYKPVRVSFAMDLSGNFWSDEPVAKKLTIINGTAGPLEGTVLLQCGAKKTQAKVEPVEPGESASVTLILPPFEANATSNETLTAVLLDSEGNELDRDELKITVYPAGLRETKKNIGKIQVFDKNGALRKSLDLAKVPYRTAGTLDEIWNDPATPALLYFPDAKNLQAYRKEILSALTEGQKLLIFTPKMGYELDSCFAKVSAPKHPAFANISDPILRLWRNGSGILYDHFLPAPQNGRARMLVEHRSPGVVEVWWWYSDRQKQTYRIDGAVLVEMAYEKGLLVLSTLKIPESNQDPNARVLLNNLVEYLTSQTSESAKAAYVGYKWRDVKYGGTGIATPEDFASRVYVGEDAPADAASIMLPLADQGSSNSALPNTSVLVIGRDVVDKKKSGWLNKNADAIRSFVKRGGTVLVLPQNPETWDDNWLPEPIQLVPLEKPTEAIEVLKPAEPLLFGVRSVIGERGTKDPEKVPARSVYQPIESSRWEGWMKPIGELKPPFKRLDGYSMVVLNEGKGRYILVQINPDCEHDGYQKAMAPMMMNLNLPADHPDDGKQISEYLSDS